MKNRTGIFFLSVILTAIASINAYGGEADPISVSNMEVTLIQKPSDLAAYEYAYYGANEFATAWNITVKKQVPSGYDTESSSEKEKLKAEAESQVTLIDSAIRNRTDAICIAPVKSELVYKSLEKAEKAGIPVCTWDTDTENAQARSIAIAPESADEMGEFLIQIACDNLKERGIDPESEKIRYCFVSSGEHLDDSEIWRKAADSVIASRYPEWEKTEKDRTSVVKKLNDVDLILCTDSEILQSQLNVLKEKDVERDEVTVTGFGSPNAVSEYADTYIYEWGIWHYPYECALACYVSAYLAAGNTIRKGDTLTVPYLGEYTLAGNDCLWSSAETDDENDGVFLLSDLRTITSENANKFDY